MDKVVFQTELYQLPAPVFETTQEHTRAVLFAHKDLKRMDAGLIRIYDESVGSKAKKYLPWCA